MHFYVLLHFEHDIDFTITIKLPALTRSKPGYTKLLVSHHGKGFNNISPKNQPEPYWPFPDMNFLSNSSPVS